MGRLVDHDDAIATRNLKVCCIGLPKTGTASLHTALSKLGYRVYHSSALVANGKRDMTLLHEALQLKEASEDDERQPYGPQELDRIWGKYDAVGDLPGFALVNELVVYYPQTQFILTDRHVDVWVKAMRETLFRLVTSWHFWLQACYDWEYARPLRRLLRSWVQGFRDFDFESGARKAYIEHVHHCLRVVPKEHLLILKYEEQTDWHDLCEFLGKKAPLDEPYPVASECERIADDEFRILWERRAGVLLGKLYGLALGIVLAVMFCWLLFVAVPDISLPPREADISLYGYLKLA